MKKIAFAIGLLIFSVCLHAQTASSWNRKGFRQAQNGNYDKAVHLFTKALEADEFFY